LHFNAIVIGHFMRKQALSMATIETRSWSLCLPDEWEFEVDDVCITAWQPTSAGALQFSTYRKDGLVTDDDVREAAEKDSEHGATLKMIILGDFSGIEICFEDQETWWRHWHLRSNDIMLFVTYNCRVASAGAEDTVVDALLANLRCL
jgi:hypothetical protein